MRLARLLIVLLILAGATACSSGQATIMQPTAFDSRPAVIFIHGYYGSTLRDVNSRRRVFLSVKEILFGKNALSLYQAELGTPPGPALEVEGLFGTFSVLPRLYNMDVYANFIKQARAIPGVQVVPFAYDWRQDLGLAVEELNTVVQALRARGVNKISIVAHSMGGLVTSYYLGYGNQKREHAKLNWAGAKQINQVLFLGTPFLGCFSVFRNMQRGADFKWNNYLLPAEAVASFPASYAVMPPFASFKSFEGKAVPVDLMDLGFWRKNRLGLLRNEAVSEKLKTARLAFTAEQLRQAKLFSDRANFVGEKIVSAPQGLSVVSVVGKGRDTVESALLVPENGEMIFNTDQDKRSSPKDFFAEGDGTVTLASAALPGPLKNGANIFYSDLAHDRLFEDKNVKLELQKLFIQ